MTLTKEEAMGICENTRKISEFISPDASEEEKDAFAKTVEDTVKYEYFNNHHCINRNGEYFMSVLAPELKWSDDPFHFGSSEQIMIMAMIRYMIHSREISNNDMTFKTFKSLFNDDMRDYLRKDENVPCPILRFDRIFNRLKEKAESTDLDYKMVWANKEDPKYAEYQELIEKNLKER